MAARYLPIVRDRLPDARLVIDSVDVHFARLAAGAGIGAVQRQMVEHMRKRETSAYRRADAVLVVSREDEATLAALSGMPPLVFVPNIVVPRPRKERLRASEAIFVGHFHHAPNVDGISWFVRDVWPRVRARHPAARVAVIGSYAPAEVRALGTVPGVEVLGYVADLEAHLDRAAVAIAPLRYGAGMKGKVTDAMAGGLPVVSTSTGAQGLGAVAGRDLLVADQPDAFASALGDLFDHPDRAAAIGLAGQRLVSALCSPERVAGTMRALVDAAPSSRDVERASRPRRGVVARCVCRLRTALHYHLITAARRQVKLWRSLHAWPASGANNA